MAESTASTVGADRGGDLLRARLARAADGPGGGRTIPPAPAGPVPLTPTQAALWFEHRVDPCARDHHRPTVLRLLGPLDLGALGSAVDALVARHPALRTSYPMVAGQPCQLVHPPTGVSIERVDFRPMSVADRSAGVAALITDAATRAFPLEDEPPFGATLATLGDDDHVLVLAVHHLSIDGTSAEVVQQDLGALYDAAVVATTPDLAPLAAGFADWAAWSSSRITDDARHDQLSWWHHVLTGPLPRLPKLGGAKDPSVPGPSAADTGLDLVPADLRPAVVAVPGELADAVRALARAEAVTLFAVIVGGLQAVVRDEWGLDDLVLGVPVSDRGHPEVDGVVGCFVRVLPIRFRMGPYDTGRSLVSRAGATIVGALDHRSVALSEIIAEAMPRDGPGQAVSPVLGHAQTRALAGPVVGPDGLRIERVPVSTPGPGVNLVVTDDGSTLSFEVSVGLDAGGPDEAGRWASRLVDQLGALVQAPDAPMQAGTASTTSDIGLAPQQLRDYPHDATLPELFARTEAEHRDEVAIEDGDRSLTFGELGDRARTLADELRSAGIGPGHAVGLDLDRSLEGVVASLAVVLAGAAYVPLDPYSPPDRINAIVADAGISVVVGAQGIERRGPAPAPALPTTTGPFAPVYVIYTSGSTGVPKGVMVHGRGIAHLVLGSDYFGLGPGDAIGMTATPAFDASTVEIWGPLLTGARGVVIDRSTLLDPARFEAVVVGREVTSVVIATAVFNAIARERPGAFATLRDLWVGGEAVEPRWVRAVLEAGPPSRLMNHYGPTEATMSSTFHVVRHVPVDAGSVPIGGPIGRTTLHVRDEQGRPAAPGLPGELYIGGPGVTLGYLNRPELTSARFVPDTTVLPPPGPLADGDPGPRLYRTGDLVVERPDGPFEFLGRVDGQVKVRGFRVELGEIEVALLRHPAVDLAAVRSWRVDGDTVLVAYLVLAAGAEVSGAELRAHLRDLVPPYMVPVRIERLDRLPLTANAKIDRAALVEPRWDTPADTVTGPPPNRGGDLDAGIVARMAEVWAANLGLAHVDPDADYFEMGGHSLKAVALLAAVAQEFGTELTMADLVWAPTARRLATAAAALARGEPAWLASSDGVIELVPGSSSSSLAPLVLLPPGGSLTFITDYRLLAGPMNDGRRVLTIIPQGLTGDAPARSVSTMVTWYVDRVRAAVPPGPVVVGGHSLGGVLALEAARILGGEGYDVSAVVMLDTQWRPPPRPRRDRTRRWLLYRAWKVRRRLGLPARSEWHRSVPGRSGRAAASATGGGRSVADRLDDLLTEQRIASRVAVRGYRPQPYDGRVVYIEATEDSPDRAGPLRSELWGSVLPALEVERVPGHHTGSGSMLREPHVATTSAAILHALAP